MTHIRYTGFQMHIITKFLLDAERRKRIEIEFNKQLPGRAGVLVCSWGSGGGCL